MNRLFAIPLFIIVVWLYVRWHRKHEQLEAPIIVVPEEQYDFRLDAQLFGIEVPYTTSELIDRYNTMTMMAVTEDEKKQVNDMFKRLNSYSLVS